jgi:fructokinase
MSYFGAIEGGGTKFVCMVGSGPKDIVAETRFPTTTPIETIGRAVSFFKEQMRSVPLSAIGIGTFGPVDLNPASPTYGYITTTPKPGWRQTEFQSAVQHALELPVGFDTDVNAAALGEGTWGACKGLSQYLYLTIGTGVGVGAVVDGRLMHGALHPEGGHMFLPHDRSKDPFEGGCPFHADCFEGLASGPAMRKRWGVPAETLPDDHPAWPLEAHYVALALSNMICMFSPQRIVLGGGVMEHTALIPLIRAEVRTILNGYIQIPELETGLDRFIVSPGLGNRSGVLGALALAKKTWQNHPEN